MVAQGRSASVGWGFRLDTLLLPGGHMQAAEGAIWYHVITVGSLIVFKLAVLLVGYLIAKLGHDLLLRGVSGEFKFRAELKGATADLLSASPGLFFILMATALIIVGVIKDKPFETQVETRTLGTTVQTGGERNSSAPRLPLLPPKENEK
jgi:hypothetical protein